MSISPCTSGPDLLAWTQEISKMVSSLMPTAFEEGGRMQASYESGAYKLDVQKYGENA